MCCGPAPGGDRLMSAIEKSAVPIATAVWLSASFLLTALPVAFSGTAMPPVLIFVSLGLGGCLVILSAIDFETLRLPDALTLPLAAAGLMLAPLLSLEPSLPWRLCAALSGFVFIWALNAGYRGLRGRAGMGLGDAKLLAVAGAWLGLEGLPSTLLYACTGALLFVGLKSARGQALTREDPLPFGPFLAAAIWLVWLYGPLV